MDTQQAIRTLNDAPPQWWRDWWSYDYSWQGLAARFGHDGARLQDYWRAETGLLIAEPGTGRLWTRFHCPLHFADGSPSPKTRWTQGQWRDLRTHISTRLALAEADRPCLLNGVVLDGLDESEDSLNPDEAMKLWLQAGGACFLGPVLARNLRFGLADFSGAWFGAGADFTGSLAPRVATALPPAAAVIPEPSPRSSRPPMAPPPTNLPKVIVTEPEVTQAAPAKPRRHLAMWLAAGAVALGAAAILLLKTL